MTDSFVLTLRPPASDLLWAPFLLLMATPFVVQAAQGDPKRAAFAVPCVVLAVLLVAVWARSRTRLGPDGLVRRTLWRTETIHWEQAARVLRMSNRLILVRRDGRNVPLSRMGHKVAVEDVKALIERCIAEHAGARPTPGTPGTVERSGGLRQALPLLIGSVAVLAVAVAAAVLSGSPLPGLLPFVIGLFVGYFAVLAARAETRITVEGIHNRKAMEKTFVPWDEVEDVVVPPSPPRYVQVVRRGGDTVTLAAISDGGTGPDGLTFDDIAALVRRKAGVPEEVAPSPGPTTAFGAGPLSLRPSRRPLLWIVPLLAALVAGTVAAFGRTPLVSAAGLMLGVSMYLAGLVLKLLRGRTEAGPDGISNRLRFRTATVSWRELDRFVLHPTLFGTVVQAVNKGGGRITLAAPREGLLSRDPLLAEKAEELGGLAWEHGGRTAARDVPRTIGARTLRTIYVGVLVLAVGIAVSAGRPWLEPWWPGRAEAGSLPAACPIAEPHAARMMPGGTAGGAGSRDDYAYFDVSSCEWSSDEEYADLRLEYKLHRRVTDLSGTDEAHDDFVRSVDGELWAGSMAVPGLGDEARRVAEVIGDRVQLRWLARRANVLIELTYTGPPTPAGFDRAIVRAAVNALDVH